PCAPGRRLPDGGEHTPGRIRPPGAGAAVIAEPIGGSSRPEGGKRSPGNQSGAAKRKDTTHTLPQPPAFVTLGNRGGGGVRGKAYYSRVHVIRPAEKARRPHRPLDLHRQSDI